MPKVSVIIPVYNVEKYIERCLESILNQTFQDFEIVVVNDCTPDKSMDIVNDYAKRDQRIHIFENEENSGLMWTRRTGYLNAKGDYFVFCDSDDWMPNDALENLYDAIEEGGHDIVIGNFEFANEKGSIYNKSNNILKYGEDRESIFRSLLLHEISHSIWGKIYRKELFDSAKLTAEKRFTNSEDAMVFYQLVDKCKSIGSIDIFVYHYFQNNSSSSKVRLQDRAIECMAIANSKISSIVSKYPELRKTLDEYLEYSCIMWILNGSKDYFKTKKILKEYGQEKYILIHNILSHHCSKQRIRILLRSILGSLIKA